MIIRDIYAGKPDAGDEIQEKGYENFAGYFIQPSGVNIEGLASSVYGTPIFIIGDKGTGKTALLHYLEHLVHDNDPCVCTSFISIRKDFDAVVLNKFDKIGKAISTSLSIDSSVASVGDDVECDFTYIWRWQLYQRIIDDNEQFNGGLFIADKLWTEFVNTVKKVDATIGKNSMHIPAEIKIFATTNYQNGTISPGVSITPIDVSNKNFTRAKTYESFVAIIKKADSLFSSLTRTDTSYYVFIDELEAYRNDDSLFFRDLRLIRDLMFTVKQMNGVLGTGTKLICSVRQEIINAINRFINPYQLQKITQGYDERLVWKYPNTNSFSHPIMEILLKRILEAENRQSITKKSREEIIEKWFAKEINDRHICTFILDKTWHKPRDIVRLLLSAQSTRAREYGCFNQHAFETFMPVYSTQCLDELREEMRALYNNREIEEIIRCLQGYKTTFTMEEISARARKIAPGSVIADDTGRVLDDLYRIGIIGNHLDGGRSDQWAHKEQYRIILESPWKMIIHPALYSELSISGRTNKIASSPQRAVPSEKFPAKKIYSVIVRDIRPRYIRVEFEKDGLPANGFISFQSLGITGVVEGEIGQYLKKGDVLLAKIKHYHAGFDDWVMRVV